MRLPSLPAGPNPVRRSSRSRASPTCCCDPGEPYDYDGRAPHATRTSGSSTGPAATRSTTTRTSTGCAARSARPDTVVVHEPYWTATARHADVVLPATHDARARRHRRRAATTAGSSPCTGRSTRRARRATTTRSSPASPSGSASATTFTEGRDARGVARGTSTSGWRETAAGRRRARRPPSTRSGPRASCELPPSAADHALFADFRADPDAHPLRTPSGRIELYSETVAGLRLRRLPRPPGLAGARASGSAPRARGRFPLLLVANQPGDAAAQPARRRRATARPARSRGREPVRLHPDDAAARGIADGDVVRVFNDRGACLAGARPRPTTCAAASCSSPTGAWFDPVDPARPSGRCACTATRTCSPRRAAPRGSRRAAPASTRSWRSRATTARCRPSVPTTPPA